MPVIGFLHGHDRRRVRSALIAAFRQGLKESRLRRGPERGDRVSLGGGPIRPPAGAGGRSGPPPGGRDRHRRHRRRRSRPRPRPRQFRSSSRPAATRSRLVSSPASTGRAAMSPASASVNDARGESGWSCCTSWCRQPRRSSHAREPDSPRMPSQSRKTCRRRRARWAGVSTLRPPAANARSTRPSRASTQRRLGALFVGGDPFF